jgi:hypothetical protein
MCEHDGAAECYREVEESIQRPDEPTGHFTVEVIQHFNGPVIQQHGSHNVANVSHNSGTGNVATAKSASRLRGGTLAPLLAQLRAGVAALPESDQTVALEHIDKLEHHAAEEEPDTLRMKVILKGLEVFGPLVPYIGPFLSALSSVGA